MDNWRTSSYSSGDGGQCVEVASGDAIMVRDTTDRENQYFVGGKWTMGDLSVKFDLSRSVEAYDFYNNGAYMSVPISGFSYSVGGSIPADINIAGQYTACWRRMSLPMRW